MKKVTCINDKNLPSGASVKEGQEYEVEHEYINGFEQRVYIIKGVPNEGTTAKGLHWVGYSATRFAITSDSKESVKEYEFALN
jgi:hypothetical protein